MAPVNEIAAATQDNLMKFLPILRQKDFGLGRAADYLESWVDGTWTRLPLLDLSERFASIARPSCECADRCFLKGNGKLRQDFDKPRTRLRRSFDERRVPSDLFSRTAKFHQACSAGVLLIINGLKRGQHPST